MKRWLLDLLVCPDCGGALSLEGARPPEGDIEEGSLRCACGKSYPVRGGIPRFVPGESYAESFGFQWNLYARTQFDDGVRRESRDTFQAKTGFRPEELRGRLVLEAGCGSGRFLDVVARGGARAVGVDLSAAVDACRRNLAGQPDVDVVQADLFRLPFRPGTFDDVYSVGVLHHTPDTRRAFHALVPLLKRGGRIAIWVYESYSTGQALSDFYRKVSRRLPKRLLHALCAVAVPYAPLKRIPILGRFFVVLFPSSDHPDWRWRWLDTFDWYSPEYQWKHRYPEVVGWFREAGLEVTEIREPPVAVQGRRP